MSNITDLLKNFQHNEALVALHAADDAEKLRIIKEDTVSYDQENYSILNWAFVTKNVELARFCMALLYENKPDLLERILTNREMPLNPRWLIDEVKIIDPNTQQAVQINTSVQLYGAIAPFMRHINETLYEEIFADQTEMRVHLYVDGTSIQVPRNGVAIDRATVLCLPGEPTVNQQESSDHQGMRFARAISMHCNLNGIPENDLQVIYTTYPFPDDKAQSHRLSGEVNAATARGESIYSVYSDMFVHNIMMSLVYDWDEQNSKWDRLPVEEVTCSPSLVQS